MKLIGTFSNGNINKKQEKNMHAFNIISVFSIVIACAFLFVCCCFCFCGAYYNYKISNGREHEMTSVVVVNETTRILPKN